MAGSQIPKQLNRDLVGLRKNLRKLAGQKLGKLSTPEFGGVKLNDLTASRLVWTDSSKTLASKDLAEMIDGTVNRVTVTDDGDGTVTLTGPQDIHTGASPTFVTTTLSGLTASRLVATDGSKALISTTAASIIAGTANQVIVTDDGDGTVTLSTPQDIDTSCDFNLKSATWEAQTPPTPELGMVYFRTSNNRLYLGRTV